MRFQEMMQTSNYPDSIIESLQAEGIAFAVLQSPNGRIISVGDDENYVEFTPDEFKDLLSEMMGYLIP